MNNKTVRILGTAFLLMTLSVQTVFAETITISSQPEFVTQEKINAENGNYVSNKGHESTKTVSSTGVLKIGAGENILGSESYTGVGPGYKQAEQGSNENNPILIDSTASAKGASGLNIDANIEKPSISSQGAVLLDAATGTVIFEKNSGAALYPASTTKLLTALIAYEKLTMDTEFTFSKTAAENLESGAATVSMATGDKMIVKDAIYATLLKSACEVANGLGEKVSGSQDAFAELMNQRAAELGCKNTHFTNASGLNSANHYSTAYDIALILSAVLDKEELKNILLTKSYKLPASKKRDALTIQNNNKMLEGQPEHVAGFIGGKTGYTSKAGNCLAVGMEYNSHRLIAVVLNSNQMHYKDAKALFEYGKKIIDANGGNSEAAQNTAENTAQTASQTAAQTTTQTTAQNTSENAAQSQAQTTTQTTTQASSQASLIAGGDWEKTGSGWKYKKADGTYAKSMWIDINGNTYFIGADELMCTGWKQFSNGAWYYFNPQNGAMVREKWVTQNDKSYYLNPDGTMAKNCIVDGKYQVDENGVYVGNVG